MVNKQTSLRVSLDSWRFFPIYTPFIDPYHTSNLQQVSTCNFLPNPPFQKSGGGHAGESTLQQVRFLSFEAQACSATPFRVDPHRTGATTDPDSVLAGGTNCIKQGLLD